MDYRYLRAAGWLLTGLALNASATVFYVDINSTNPVPPFAGWSTAATNIQDAIDSASAGDQVLVNDGVYQTGGVKVSSNAYTNRVAVTKSLTVQSVHGPTSTVIQGYAGFFLSDSLRCVYLTNGAFLSGFTLTQGVADSGAGLWCESMAAVASNCVISGNSAQSSGGASFSGTLTDCILSTNHSGSGGGAYVSALRQCTLEGNSASLGGGVWGALLTNSTMSGNWAADSGGAAASATLNHCTLIGNAATNFGGGSYGGSLTNCVVAGNQAYQGGGAFAATLVNCTVVNNSATEGGGAYACLPKNSILYYNNATTHPNYVATSTTGLTNCCSVPIPSGLAGFNYPPLFVSLAKLDLHLQINSPCINAGNNAFIMDPTDLDGNPRVAGGTVDVGAYEVASPSSILSYAWLEYYGLPTDGSADLIDSDGDGMNNWQEWKSGTDPTNPFSVFKQMPAVLSGSPATVTLQWLSVNTVSYYVERSTNLAAVPAFSALQSNIVGQAGTTSYIDNSATNGGNYFYRVGVQ